MHKHPESPKAPIPVPKPPLKWTGGKARIINEIVGRLPVGRRLIEPFVGGASVFLASSYDRYLLGDANQHLIDLYRSVVHRFDDLLALTSSYFIEDYRSKERYLEVRSAFNRSQDPLERSAQFLYLNRFGFNGLCRYNQSGEYNVPYGKPARVPRLPVERLVAFREKAARATFVAADFITVMRQAVPGDVVYCDPPYLDRDSAGRSFTGYGASGFGFDRHRELASMARTLAAQGVPVLISNHDCEAARSLYEGAQLFQFEARRSISADATRRATATELVAFFSPRHEQDERPIPSSFTGLQSNLFEESVVVG
ncbi:DNA adenine methylase [Paraburkholderia azotifigens]|uniref:Site-specific DNA-methyltransferase (adenine-specific) n=1 Tax=Paraburkholderia azotifigens TaxID=2057004 RepID=A0A5C6V0R5_9BURK|nr:DNA adenine methylase [Paraburkholderia azotifigens]TXC79097.1 DNA adenine methylase [Paraburkholderia azotifigens]